MTLTWSAGVGATGYNIKRSLVTGGPYTVIGTSAASPYVDLTAVNGTAYYYVVSSTNACGESVGNSLESHATPIVAVVSDWVQRVQNNGGAQPSLATTVAMNNFAVSLMACAIDSLMISVNCFVPDSLIAALTPLYAGPGSDPWTNVGPFLAGDLNINGLAGDGITKYLGTGIVPANVFGATSTGVTIYIPVAYNPAIQSSDIGSADVGVVSSVELSVCGAANAILWASYDYAGGLIAESNVGGFTGLFSGNRTAANSSVLYVANSVTPFNALASIATFGGVLANITSEFTVFSRNFGGSVFSPSSHTLSFVAVHAGLTATQDQCLYNAVQALRIALGGGWI